MKKCAILLPAIGVLALSLSLPVRAEDGVVDYSKYGDYAKYGTVKDVPGACSYDAIGKKHYAGRTLRIIAHAVPVWVSRRICTPSSLQTSPAPRSTWCIYRSATCSSAS